jgi:hypothetical protein
MDFIEKIVLTVVSGVLVPLILEWLRDRKAKQALPQPATASARTRPAKSARARPVKPETPAPPAEVVNRETANAPTAKEDATPPLAQAPQRDTASEQTVSVNTGTRFRFKPIIFSLVGAFFGSAIVAGVLESTGHAEIEFGSGIANITMLVLGLILWLYFSRRP